METTIVHWGYLRIMEKRWKLLSSILGLWRDNRKEAGNYYSILEICRGHVKENGDGYSRLMHGDVLPIALMFARFVEVGASMPVP